MTRRSIRTWLAAVAAATSWGVVCVRAAMPDSPETWGNGAVAGWTRQDPLNACSLSLSNPTNYLQVVFGGQSQPFPEVNIIRADVAASDGAFAGDYWDAAVTNVSFKLSCGSRTPGALHLCFFSGASSNWWYYPLNVPSAGGWTDYSVPLEDGAGWLNGACADSGQFKKDRSNVSWIGIRVQRNSSLEAQVYGLDDFVLRGASRLKDADADGASDWQEFIAGTDPGDSNSRLAVKMDGAKTNSSKALGIVLRWPSAPGRTYSVRRATDLSKGFSTIKSGIPGKSPQNEHEDVTATNGGVYFYQVGAE